jgi:hypothetical protein
MAHALPEQLIIRVRTILRNGDHPRGASGSTAQWRAERDRWMDELDPRKPGELSEVDIRGLIDFLAESGPSAHSRMSIAEWHSAVDNLTPELLFNAR